MVWSSTIKYRLVLYEIILCDVLVTWCCPSQSSLTGVPTLVSPNAAKVDLSALKSSLPRYATSGLSPPMIQWWEAFVQMLEDSWKSTFDVVLSSWLFSDIVHIKQSARLVRVQSPRIPAQLEHMREDEETPIPEVSYLSLRMALINE